MPLKFNRSQCTGCKLCQLACSAAHENVFNPEKARIKIIHEYVTDGIVVKARRCIVCGECEQVCPSSAISNTGTHMMVDHDTCIGCGTCVETCPTNVIFLNNLGKSEICDLCDGSPQCVKWCPKGALTTFEKKEEAIS